MVKCLIDSSKAISKQIKLQRYVIKHTKLKPPEKSLSYLTSYSYTYKDERLATIVSL